MNGAQIHLLANHLPVLGAAFAAALTAAGLALRKDDVVKAGLWSFVASALLALPAYFSGEEAEEVVEHLPGVLESIIHDHEEAAEKALVAVLLLGGAALGALIQAFKGGQLSRKICAGVLALSLPVLGLLSWTAHLGGLVRHTELRADTGPIPIPGPLPIPVPGAD